MATFDTSIFRNQYDPVADQIRFQAMAIQEQQAQQRRQEEERRKQLFQQQQENYADVKNQVMGYMQGAYQPTWSLNDAMIEYENAFKPQQPQMSPQQALTGQQGPPPQMSMAPPQPQSPLQQSLMPQPGPMTPVPPQAPQAPQPPIPQSLARAANAPPMQRFTSPAPTTYAGWQVQQEMQKAQQAKIDAEAKKVTHLLEMAQKSNRPDVASMASKLFAKLPGYEEYGQLVDQLKIGSPTERNIPGFQLKQWAENAPDKLKEYGFTASDVSFNPLDVVTFKKDDTGNWAFNNVKPYKGMVGNTKPQTYVEKDEDGELVQVTTVGGVEQSRVPFKDTYQGRSLAVREQGLGLRKEEIGLKAPEVRGRVKEEEAYGKEIGKGEYEARAELPKVQRNIEKFENLKKEVKEKGLGAFGKWTEAKAYLAKFSPKELETVLKDVEQRKKLIADASQLISLDPDFKKLFGPPFSDTDMKLMREMAGSDLSSPTTFIQALNNGIEQLKGKESDLREKLKMSRRSEKQGEPPAKKSGMDEKDARASIIAELKLKGYPAKLEVSIQGKRYVAVKQPNGGYSVLPKSEGDK